MGNAGAKWEKQKKKKTEKEKLDFFPIQSN